MQGIFIFLAAPYAGSKTEGVQSLTLRAGQQSPQIMIEETGRAVLANFIEMVMEGHSITTTKFFVDTEPKIMFGGIVEVEGT